MMQRSNRKSHLQAPLSPATQALLRSEGPFSGHSPSKTPTSGDILIATGSSTSSSQYTPDSAISRPFPAGGNGTPIPSSARSSTLDRPPYPFRTSSSNALDSKHENLHQPSSIMMPLRPAPPSAAPNGPLPIPPASASRTTGLRRPDQSKEINGNSAYPGCDPVASVYANGEGQPL